MKRTCNFLTLILVTSKFFFWLKISAFLAPVRTNHNYGILASKNKPLIIIFSLKTSENFSVLITRIQQATMCNFFYQSRIPNLRSWNPMSNFWGCVFHLKTTSPKYMFPPICRCTKQLQFSQLDSSIVNGPGKHNSPDRAAWHVWLLVFITGFSPKCGSVVLDHFVS